MDESVVTKKISVYQDVMDLFIEFTDPMVQRQVGKNPKKQEVLGRRIVNIGTKLALFGGDEVVRKYVEFRLLAQGGETDKIIDCFAAVILAMRVDLCGETAVTEDHVLGTFLTTDDSELKKKGLTTKMDLC